MAWAARKKNKISLLELGILGIWVFSRFFLPHIIDFLGSIFTGYPLFQCTAVGSAQYYCPTTGHLYFLVLLFWARILAVTWHWAVTSRYSKDLESALNGVLIVLSVLFALFGWAIPLPVPELHPIFLPFAEIGLGCVHLYITLYLVCFYFGYRVLPKRESIKGPWQVICPLLFFAYLGGCYVLTQLELFPLFDSRSNDLLKVVAYFANALPFACLFLCFLKLPAQFDIRISGVALLCIYVLHEELKNWIMLGVRIHGRSCACWFYH
jgi:hypothetical protein